MLKPVTTGGTYTLVLHDWNPTDHSTAVSYTLTTRMLNTGAPGPALTLSSSGQ